MLHRLLTESCSLHSPNRCLSRTEGQMTADWQGNTYAARPETPLWAMNIPGTHDSCARTNHFAYADKCQTWSITEQLNNGIRFLDLRLNYNNDNNRDAHGFTGYDIYHGGFQYATFKPAWYGPV